MPELKDLGQYIAQLSEPYEDNINTVISRNQINPPLMPAIDDSYIVTQGGTGAWLNKPNFLAKWSLGGWIFTPPIEGMQVWVHSEKLELIYNGSTWQLGSGSSSSTSGSSGAVLSRANKRMPVRTTVHDGDRACDIAIARNLADGASISILVNGVVESRLGDGTKLNASCYLSGDGGYTARSLSDVQAGDVLYWNGSVAGYELDAAYDIIDFLYEEKGI